MSEQLSRTPLESLEAQINELGRLRNAGTCSPEFKAWRQATLTLIQRIWPARAEYAERFRRVPFTAPSTRADREEVRECFERGCGEALTHLKMLREMCGNRQWSDVDAEAGTETFEVGSAEDDFPTLDLPPAPDSRPKSPPKPPKHAKKHGQKGAPKLAPAPPPPVSPVLGELLAEAEGRGSRPAPPPLPVDEARVLPPELEPPPPPPPARKENGKSKARAAKIGKKNHKARLKDLLGLAEEPLGSAVPEPDEAEEPISEMPQASPRMPEAPQAATPPAAPEPPRSAMARALEHPDRTIAPVPRINPLPDPPLERPATPPASHVQIPRLPPETDPADIFDHDAEVPPAAEAPPASAARPAAGQTLGDMLLGPDIRARLEAGAEAPPATPTREHMTDPYTSYGELEGDVLDSITRGSAPDAQPPAAAAPPAPTPAPPAPPIEEHLTEPMMLDPSDLEADELEADELEEAADEEVEELEEEYDEEDDVDEFGAGEDPDELEAERATEEFLRNSPVLSMAPKPVPSRPSPPADPSVRPHELTELPSDAAAKARSVEAAVIRALTPMVEELGVPAGQRAVARAALADLARHLDQNEVTWEILREAVAFVMEYPALARRVLPLLIPYFDRAA